MKKLIVICSLLFVLFGCMSEPVGSLTEISMQTFQEQVDSKETFIVLFSQTTCSFCKAYKETLKDYMKEHPLDVVYIEVDKEENTDAFDLLLEDKLDKLEYLPATVYVKDGEVVDFCEGELMPEQIEIWLYRNGIELD
ncbi:MAG: thioredoxin family protein [Erysipelotrichaceae bacterium]|nr:thioredoxin family protein [Erysipelotrichaceae bacterium]